MGLVMLIVYFKSLDCSKVMKTFSFLLETLFYGTCLDLQSILNFLHKYMHGYMYNMAYVYMDT